MPPVLLSVVQLDGDQLAVTWSVRPGRRVVLVTPADGWSDDVAALMIASVLPAIEERQS